MQVRGICVWLTLVLLLGCGVAYLQDEHAQFVQSQHRSSSDAVEIWQKTGSALQSRRQKRSFDQECPSDNWELYGDNCYRFFPNALNTWHNAEQICQAEGAHLASITSWPEASYIHTLMEANNRQPIFRRYWIGLFRQGEGNNFAWIDGSPNVYQRWQRNQPDNALGDQDCGRVAVPDEMHIDDSYWDDYQCRHLLGFTCKVPKESLCEYPGKPEHGDVFGTWPAKVRSMTTFDCDPGYALIGTEMIECKADQTWTGQIPQCQRMTCPEPEKKDHMQILNSRDIYTYGEEVWYICDEGYLLRGPEIRQCKAHDGTINGRWTGFDPICLAVRCDDLMDPINGVRHGHVFTYGSFVTFNCSTGYKLVGSYKMMCMSSGRWYGRFPECVQIECDAPFEPRNGEVRLRNAMYGAAVSFQCDDGFHLVGNRVLRCEESGNWNGSEPTCEAATCGNPGIPAHGAKDGSIYYYPHQVYFSCFTGYILRGINTISCQSDGTWSSTLPVCEACPRGTYMDDTHEEKQCKACPEFSHTSTNGSTSRHQCVCNQGYTGPAGGPCQEIRCPTLSAPEFGTINECENQLNHSCLFNCDDGYILDKGSSMRACQSNGQWDGTQPSCSSCEKDTYKSDVRSCMPCPANSHADGVANMLEDCVCDSGYQGPTGGPCTDGDECQENEGHGPCSDLCENRIGDYKCACSIPGYGLDPDDQHTCIVENQCRNLTEADAPTNGGLVCHWYHEGNAQQCTNKCNKGFEFPTRSNNYETCGPHTDYIWTFRRDDPQANIIECIEAFFPGIQVEGETNYFVRACADLTEEEKLDVKNTFVAKLNENDICAQSASKNCDINDMAIICGARQLRRRKRGVDAVLHSIDFSFNITALKIFGKVHNCSEICAMSPIPDRFCVEELCISVTMRYMRAAVMYAKRQLGDLFATSEGRDRLTFTAAKKKKVPTATLR